jgi:uncharacterized alpha-E superfamily protein
LHFEFCLLYFAFGIRNQLTMLSRVADALFWMSRYLERADHVARLLDVCFHLDLDLGGVILAPYELHWTGLAAILQQPVPATERAAEPTPARISEWMAFDPDNPSSIVSCVTRARANARSIRGSISSQMWRELNKLYWQLRDPVFSNQARESPHEFFQAVECGNCLFQGVCDATLNHDEGWQFIQLGKFLERADKTVRTLDVHHKMLQERSTAIGLPLADLQWAAVLRSCRAYESYQRLYVGRVEAERVVEFLLLHPECPRSVRFSLEAAARALRAIEGPGPGRDSSQPDRALGLVLAELRFRDLEEILAGDLHVFLAGVLERCARVSLAVQDRYSLH